MLLQQNDRRDDEDENVDVSKLPGLTHVPLASGQQHQLQANNNYQQSLMFIGRQNAQQQQQQQPQQGNPFVHHQAYQQQSHRVTAEAVGDLYRSGGSFDSAAGAASSGTSGVSSAIYYFIDKKMVQFPILF
jgi:hypothetical protein